MAARDVEYGRPLFFSSQVRFEKQSGHHEAISPDTLSNLANWKVENFQFRIDSVTRLEDGMVLTSSPLRTKSVHYEGLDR
jgi:hypothetical protein